MGRRRNKDQIARDRAIVARLYCQRWLQVDIAEKLGVTQQQVSYDLQAIREEWHQSTIRDFDQARSEELAKIDNLELEHWEGYRRTDDIRHLQGVQWCIVRRCKLLGLDEPDKVDVKHEDAALSDTDRANKIIAILDAARERADRPAD